MAALNAVTRYARDVIAHKIIAGPHVVGAAKRHIDDLKRSRRDDYRWEFRPDLVTKYITSWPVLFTLSGGEHEGKPFVLLPWQEFIVGSIFGWVEKTTGYRRYNWAYIETAKGSGKTPLGGAISLMLCALDGEERAEVYSVAVTEKQAKLPFLDAVAMVRHSPALENVFRIHGGSAPNRISYKRTNSFFVPMSTERSGRGKSGPKPNCVLIEELHEHPTGSMVDFMTMGFKNRRQPLALIITNSGANRASVCWEYHQRAINVVSGVGDDDRLFSYVCASDPDDVPFDDESCWIKTNPSLPIAPGYEYLRNQVADAKEMSSKRNTVRRLCFCEWTESYDAWITYDIWSRVVDNELVFEDEIYTGRDCYMGLDLSISGDLTALVLGIPMPDGAVHAFPFFWINGDRLEEIAKKYSMWPLFQTWVNEGFLNASTGGMIDYKVIARVINEMHNRFNVKYLAYDRWNIKHLEMAFKDLNLLAPPMIEHPQGFHRNPKSDDDIAAAIWMPRSIELAEKMFTDGALKMSHNPVMNWCVAHTQCKASTLQPTDRHFVRPSKGGEGKIDGSVAMVQMIGILQESTLRTSPIGSIMTMV